MQKQLPITSDKMTVIKLKTQTTFAKITTTHVNKHTLKHSKTLKRTVENCTNAFGSPLDSVS